MKDPVARQRAEEAIEQVGGVERRRQTDAAGQDRKIEDLRRLVAQAALDEDSPVKGNGGSLTAINPLLTSTTSAWPPLTSSTHPGTSGVGVYKAYNEADRASAAVRVAVLTIVLCYENLRDALQFDTWGGLQDATSLDERAQVLRGWLGSVTDVEMGAATACYDELAGT